MILIYLYVIFIQQLISEHIKYQSCYVPDVLVSSKGWSRLINPSVYVCQIYCFCVESRVEKTMEVVCMPKIRIPK